MSKQRSRSRSGVFSPACVLLAALALQPGCRDKGSAPAGASASGDAANGAVQARWPLDETATYALELRTLSDTGQTPMALLLTLNATMDVTFRAMNRGDGTVTRRAEIRLRDVGLRDHAKRPAQGAEQLVRELGVPFGLEFVGDELSSYFEDPGSGHYAAGYRRQIAALLQAPATAGGAAREWDATGLARVEYGPSPSGQGLSWKKVGYERALIHQSQHDDAVDANQLKPKVAASSGQARFDERGLVELRRHEEIRAPLTVDRSISTTLDVSLVRTGSVKAKGPAPAGMFEPGRRRSVDAPVIPTRRANWNELMVGGRTFPQVIAQYDQWSRAKEGVDGVPAAERAALFRALVGLLRTDAETVKLTRKLVEAGSPAQDTLVDALGTASTPDSLRVLAELVFAPRSSRPLRIRAATSLIRAPEPGESALVAVERMIPDETFREHGLLGTGTYARLLRQGGKTALSERATRRLAQELEAAKAPRDRSLVLLAIANSGDAALYDRVLSDQDSKDAAVRRAAIQAIRLMDDPRVEPRLRELLTRTDAGDLEAALQALGRRETALEALVADVEKLSRDHAAPMVRREAVLALVKWREKWPRVEPVLRERQADDVDKRVREAARATPAPAEGSSSRSPG